MRVDWKMVLDIGVRFGLLVLGALVTWALERRQKLSSYLLHVSAFVVQGEKPMAVHSHSIVVQNSGRKAATNVRLNHKVMPSQFNVWPSVQHEVVQLPAGGADLVFPRLVPKEQVTVSYMYFPPLTWEQIQGPVKSDDGFAKVLNVIPTPQPPKWVVRLLSAFVFVGVVGSAYAVIQLVGWVIAHAV